MDVALYYAQTTCALAPYISLTEANADFDIRPLNFRKGQNKSPDYMKINPKHKVPLLVVDGEPLTESTAIQIWIARNFPDAKLLPSDPWQELKAISLFSWCSSGIHPYLSRINNTAKVCDAPNAADSVRKFAVEALTECFGIADDMLAGHDYFFDNFTAPDGHFFWCCRRATQFDIDLSGWSNVASHFARMQTRESVKQLIAYEKEVMDGFAAAA